MRLLYWMLVALAAIVLTLFAVSNRGEALKYWSPHSVPAPLAVAAMTLSLSSSRPV